MGASRKQVSALRRAIDYRVSVYVCRNFLEGGARENPNAGLLWAASKQLGITPAPSPFDIQDKALEAMLEAK